MKGLAFDPAGELLASQVRHILLLRDSKEYKSDLLSVYCRPMISLCVYGRLQTGLSSRRSKSLSRIHPMQVGSEDSGASWTTLSPAWCLCRGKLTRISVCSWSPEGTFLAVPNSVNNGVFVAGILKRKQWDAATSLVGHDNVIDVIVSEDSYP